ncbi:hypothetical protein [Asticcacaulis endophyticus]|uniref:Uncharacterized protein n=1 Tax=Asticcacaulis endophyticus TaxID=1395890 RepID=A0A918QCF3_9CAUL|nr:hypothetical protein [Asticcacaulis endophyticus]GGZ39219.1 hypothetical protein GCM10011273_27050 [Asticcacaulis endophyticus]
MTVAQAGLAVAVIIGLWALWRGGLTERVGAAIIVGGWCLTALLKHNGLPTTTIAVLDIIVTVALIWLFVWSRKTWTLFAASFQLLAILTHFAASFTGYHGWFAYLTPLNMFGGYGLLLALAVGIIQAELYRARRARP